MATADLALEVRYNLESATTLEFTGGSYGVGSIAGAGDVQIEGIDSPAKLYWSGTMNIAVQTLTVQAGAYSASIDPPDLTLDVPGGVSLTGGSTNGAYALIQGGNVSITTSTIDSDGGRRQRKLRGHPGDVGQREDRRRATRSTMVPGSGAVLRCLDVGRRSAHGQRL